MAQSLYALLIIAASGDREGVLMLFVLGTAFVRLIDVVYELLWSYIMAYWYVLVLHYSLQYVC